MFWLGLLATPVVLWLVFAGKLRARGKPLPLSPGTWPVWEAFAASVAFAVWAIALPDSPFAEESWYTPVLTGGAVL